MSRQQLAQVDGDLQQPVGFYDFRVVLEPPSARLTAAWRTASLGPGEQPYMLQAATRAPSGPWLAPVTIDPRKDFGSPVFLGADGRGEVYAIWLGEPRPDSNDVELRAATRGTDGIWSPPAALARATAGIPYEQMALKGAVTSPSGQLFVLVARNDQHPTRPTHSRRSVQAFTRTPDHVWSGPDTVARSKWRSQRHCISGDLAMLDQERALAIWSCRAGGAGRKVRVAALVP